MADQLSLALNVCVSFDGFELDVALDLPAGATLAVTGPNGAGKTTLLRTIAGIQPIDAGRISLGRVVVDEPASKTWVAPEDRNVGLVFQDHRLFPAMSVRDNVSFGLRARRRHRRDAHAEADRWISLVGLAERSETDAVELSGGQAQRIALARALAVSPTVVLLDEPFASVDEASRRSMLSVLAELETTTVVATHDQEVVEALADDVVTLEAGQLA